MKNVLSAFTLMQIRSLTRVAVIALGSATWAIGGMTVLGYLGHVTTLYQWGNAIAMSPNSGVAFVCCGLAILFLGASNRIWGTERTRADHR